MKKTVLLHFALLLCFSPFCLGQDKVTTVLGSPSEGWAGGPGNHIANQVGFGGCLTEVSLSTGADAENFELAPRNGTAAYRIGGGNQGSVDLNIRVTISFGEAVWNPSLCIAGLNEGVEGLMDISPRPIGFDQDLVSSSRMDTIKSITAGGAGCIQWPGLVSEISFTYDREFVGLGLLLESLSFLPCNISCYGAGDATAEWQPGGAGFESEYSSGASLMPGEYLIVEASGAAAFDDEWLLFGPGCDDEAPVMLVNGRTGQSGEQFAAIWQNTFSGLDPDREYLLTAEFKSLGQGSAGAHPTLRVTAGGASTDFEVATGSDPCDWQSLNLAARPGPDGEIVVAIQLSESGPGDGNDLAIGGVRLFEGALTEPVWGASVFSLSVTSLGGSLGNLKGKTLGELPDETCTSFWSICEEPYLENGKLLCRRSVTSPEWLVEETAFNGYIAGQDELGDMTEPGVFDISTLYFVRHIVNCPCIRSWFTAQAFIQGRFVTEEDFEYIALLPQSESALALSTIAPNPTRDKFVLNLELPSIHGKDGQVTISVLDISGRTISERQSSYSSGQLLEEELTLAGQPAGLYLVAVSKDGAVIASERVVKIE